MTCHGIRDSAQKRGAAIDYHLAENSNIQGPFASYSLGLMINKLTVFYSFT